MAIKDIYDSIINLNDAEIVAQVQTELDSGTTVTSILQEGLIGVLDEVGRRFSEGDMFVPEMLKAAQVMKEGRIDAVFVGADRIAANGDAANKIGTYGVAVLADAHDIPFYVLAPTSTIDLATPTGDQIPIEERGADEIIRGFGKLTAPEDVQVYSPAFDVTPARLIKGIICEHGIAEPDFGASLAAFCALKD